MNTIELIEAIQNHNVDEKEPSLALEMLEDAKNAVDDVLMNCHRFGKIQNGKIARCGNCSVFVQNEWLFCRNCGVIL